MPHNAAVHALNDTADNSSALSGRSRTFGEKEVPSLRMVQGKQKNSRTIFIVSCVGILATALVAVLLLNMSISSGQYYLVRLKSEEKAHRQNNQVLRQEAEKDSVSQNLAARAVALGMVPLTTAAYLNIQEGTIRGETKAAQKDQKMEQNVPSPQLPDIGVLKSDRQEAGLEQQRQAPEAVVTGGTVPPPKQRVANNS